MLDDVKLDKLDNKILEALVIGNLTAKDIHECVNQDMKTPRSVIFSRLIRLVELEYVNIVHSVEQGVEKTEFHIKV